MEVRKMMATFKQPVMAGLAVLVMCGTAAAQTPTATDAQRIRAEADRIRDRQDISTMEGILQRAILNGADMVLAQVRSVMPTDRSSLSGMPRVRGDRLEDYGVLFHVEVPELRLPIMWEMRQFLVQDSQARNAEMAIQQLRTTISGMSPGPERETIQQSILELQRQVALGNLRGGEKERRAVGAASLVPAVPAAAGQTVSIDQQVVDDPEGAYTREIKVALIDAMLRNNQTLSVAADEWLAVVARDGAPTSPLFPGDSIDASTWVMRVKGSVLSAFRSGTITLEEARKRVEVREQ